MDVRARARQLRAGRTLAERRLWTRLRAGQHAEGREADAARTARLERLGYRVIRFWNHEVLENVEGVVEAILAELRERKGPPSRPPP